MKFYQDDKPGLVWNPKKDRLSVKFVDGTIDANDEQAEILKANGYRYDDHVQTPKPVKRTTRRKKAK